MPDEQFSVLAVPAYPADYHGTAYPRDRPPSQYARYSPGDRRGMLRKVCACRQNSKHNNALGCESCNHTGYCGRIAIAEIVLTSAELEDFIYRRISKIELLKKIEKQTPNFTLEQKAHQLVTNGITDMREVCRVVK